MISRKGVTPVEWCKCNQYEIALKPRRVPVISTTILPQFLEINKKTTILKPPLSCYSKLSPPHLSPSGGPAWSARQPHQGPRREVLGLPCWQVSSSSANDESFWWLGTKISKFLLCGELKSMDNLNWYCDQKSCQVLEGACWEQLRPAGSPLPDGGEEALLVLTPHWGTRLAGNR